MLLAQVAAASAEVSATSARLGKIARLASTLGAASEEELPIVVAWLSGDLPQRQIGVGWAALRSMPAAAATSTLTVSAVDAALSAIGATSGAGSQARRSYVELFRSTPVCPQHRLDSAVCPSSSRTAPMTR